jgi:hypothetical protein
MPNGLLISCGREPLPIATVASDEDARHPAPSPRRVPGRQLHLLVETVEKELFVTGVWLTTGDFASCRVSLPSHALAQRMPQSEHDEVARSDPWSTPPVLPEIFTLPVHS